MKYVGMRTQIRRNNRLSVLLLIAFPAILLAITWVFIAVMNYLGNEHYDYYGGVEHRLDLETVNFYFLQALPWVVGAVSIWFLIAYRYNSDMVRRATGARPLERRENMRVYNIVENLCIAGGMNMPQVYVVDDPQLNAYASGIDEKSYAVTLTTGIIDTLNDEELAGVVGHELTHIRNHDTRLLITSIIFVGIVSTVMSLIVRTMYYTFIYGGDNRSRRNSKEGNGLGIIAVLAIALVCSVVAYFFIMLTRFAISRKREYMADAGGAELCGNPLALASALRKISALPGLTDVKRDDVAQLFIVHPQGIASGFMRFLSSAFSTHPDTARRIEILEQF